MTQADTPGLDRFRMLAAFLVIAIHTSPLASLSDTADFLLTRALARVGVPFFFMVSGYFVLGALELPGARFRIRRFAYKTALLYTAATALYLPVNWYAGRLPATFPAMIRTIVADGTFYHLWYFPAVIFGMALTSWMVRHFGWRVMRIAAVLLYLCGLLGDSYYGLAALCTPLRNGFTLLFQFFHYTRNGLFFAPLFLTLGANMATNRRADRENGRPGSRVLLLLSLLLLFAEACMLRHAGWPRHDSMYLTLPLCMYALFSLLLSLRGKAKPEYRPLCTAIYILHPLVIVCVRGFARLSGTQWLLVATSPVHYTVVAFGSVVTAVVLLRLFRQLSQRNTAVPGRAWAEVDLSALQYNASRLQRLMTNGCRMMAVLKANAYGHGAVPVARALARAGVQAFAVATVDEGIRLRRAGIAGEMLVLGCTDPGKARLLRRYELTQTVADLNHARGLSARGVRLRVHLKIDTGMHRLGIDWQAHDAIMEVAHLPYLQLTGLFTHLCMADTGTPEAAACTELQLARFETVRAELERRGLCELQYHAQSSYGLLNYPGHSFSCARVGIALYGARSSPQDLVRVWPDLRPVLSVRARVVLVRALAPGGRAGYAGAFTAARETRLAVLPIGYADGWPRALSSGRGTVLLHGCRAPIVGRICMDQLFVDITDIPAVRTGDAATLLGVDGGAILSAEEVATAAGTISNELLSRLSPRLPRVYSDAKQSWRAMETYTQ